MSGHRAGVGREGLSPTGVPGGPAPWPGSSPSREGKGSGQRRQAAAGRPRRRAARVQTGSEPRTVVLETRQATPGTGPQPRLSGQARAQPQVRCWTRVPGWLGVTEPSCSGLLFHTVLGLGLTKRTEIKKQIPRTPCSITITNAAQSQNPKGVLLF